MHDDSTFRPTSRAQRWSLAAGAACATTALLSAVLLSFEGAAPDIWLAPTREVLEAAAECDELDARAARDACKQIVVNARLAGQHVHVRVARLP